MAGLWNKLRGLFGGKKPPKPPSVAAKRPQSPEGRVGVALGSLKKPLAGLNPSREGVYSPTEVDDFVYGGHLTFVNSTNVAAVQYNLATHEMAVTFLSGGEYVYSSVSEQEAISFMQAQSKGVWVWDHLRIRGSKTGHRKPFRKTSANFGRPGPKDFEQPLGPSPGFSEP